MLRRFSAGTGFVAAARQCSRRAYFARNLHVIDRLRFFLHRVRCSCFNCSRLEEGTKRARQGREGAVVEEAEEALDAELWGRLQDHIPLHTVYEKLPLEDRLRLRFVCKAWNRSALQRLEPKPYFVTIAVGHLMRPRGGYLNGHDVVSGEFGFERQPFYHGGLLQGGADSVTPGVCWVLPREVEGLILCRHPHDALDQLGVYSIHIKMWHAVPPALKNIICLEK